MAAPTEILRPGLLGSLRLTCAYASDTPPALAGALASLGADVSELRVDPLADEPAGAGAPDVLVWDGAGAFASAGLTGALDGAWLAIRASFAPEPHAGKILLVAPGPGDAHAEAARSGLENLARTLSIEWARFGVRTLAVLPGAATDPASVATLVAYAGAPAGDYFSGTALTLA